MDSTATHLLQRCREGSLGSPVMEILREVEVELKKGDISDPTQCSFPHFPTSRTLFGPVCTQVFHGMTNILETRSVP